jgi:RND superfamily putative drug exporter
VIEHLRDKGLGVGQTGFAVAFGIVIASFVMAMFFTPALTTLFGRAAWWPRRIHPPAEHRSAPLPADQHAGPVQDSGSYAPRCSGSRRD